MANRSPQLFADGYAGADSDVPLRSFDVLSGVDRVTSGAPDPLVGLKAAVGKLRPITVIRRNDRAALTTPLKVVEAFASGEASAEQPDGVTE